MPIDYGFGNNFLLGRGKMLISDDRLNWYDLGNTPAFGFTVDAQSVEHRSSREVLKLLDKEVTTQQDITGSITLDTVHPENIRLFLLGDTITEIAQSSATAATNNLFAAKLGHWKNLADDESGHGNFTYVHTVSNVVVMNVTDTTTYVLGVDYLLDEKTGMIMILASGSIADAANLHLTFDVAAKTARKIGAAKVARVEKHIRFEGNPASGSQIIVEAFANMKPTGEIPLLGDDFTTFQFEFKFLRKTGYTGLLDWIDLGEVA